MLDHMQIATNTLSIDTPFVQVGEAETMSTREAVCDEDGYTTEASCTLDPMQEGPVVPSLSALLAHLEFQKGWAYGHEFFFDRYEEAPLTEDEMIEEVEGNLSRRIIARGKKIARLVGDKPSSYFYHLGFVVGTIDQGLTYGRSHISEAPQCHPCVCIALDAGCARAGDDSRERRAEDAAHNQDQA